MSWNQYQVWCVLGGLHDRRWPRTESKVAIIKARTEDEAQRKVFAVMRRRFLTGFCRVELCHD